MNSHHGRHLLGGALLWGHESNGTVSAATTLRRGLPDRLKAAVLARDNHVCRCCGFRSEQFQEVMVWDGSTRDPDRMATACIFCHQAFHLDWVPGMRSGHLIWLPEMDQIELNRLVREARVFTRRSSGTLAKKVIEHLADRRGAAHERLGTDSLEEAISVLRQTAAAGDPRFDDLMSGLRLLPSAHRFVTEASFEYNQFPRIVDYWRSPGGPCGGVSDHPLLDDYARQMMEQPSMDSASESEADGAVSIDETSGEKHQTRAEQGIRDVDVEFGADCEWTPMGGEMHSLLEPDSPIDGMLYLRRDGTSYFSTLLPWYANARLLRVTDEDWPVEGMAIYYLMASTNDSARHDLLRLDGSSEPIHQMNRRHGIQLDGDNVVGYLRFFCYFVHGDEGPFLVTDDAARRELMQGSDGADLDALLPALEAPLAKGPDESGSYQCEAGVWYATSLFTASFRISANGEIEMEDDEQVASGLRIRPQARIRL